MNEPNYEMFLAHGDRPLLTDLELDSLYYSEEDIYNKRKPYDDKRYIYIPEDDERLYLTFTKLNKSLTDFSIFILLTAFGPNPIYDNRKSHPYIKNLFYNQLKYIISTGPTTKYNETRKSRYWELLLGIIIYGFIRNLFNIRSKHVGIWSDSKPSGIYLMPIEYNKMFKCNFSVLKNIDFNYYFRKKRFSQIPINFENKDVDTIYKFVINNIYKIDYYLWKIENNIPLSEIKENMFNYLRFIPFIDKQTTYTLLCLYKLLIIIVCFYMKELPTKNIDIFYSILNDNSILEILLNVERDKTLHQGTFVENIENLIGKK